MIDPQHGCNLYDSPSWWVPSAGEQVLLFSPGDELNVAFWYSRACRDEPWPQTRRGELIAHPWQHSVRY